MTEYVLMIRATCIKGSAEMSIDMEIPAGFALPNGRSSTSLKNTEFPPCIYLVCSL